MSKVKKRGLGRGLEALIPDMIGLDMIEENVHDEKVQIIDIDKIHPNPDQPRKNFDEKSMNVKHGKRTGGAFSEDSGRQKQIPYRDEENTGE
jgi:hypothetical protein